MSHPVVVACPCPGTPHETDTVELREKLGLAGGIAVQTRFTEAFRGSEAPDEGRILGVLAEVYLLEGVESWTFVDDAGTPVPVTREAVQTILLDDFTIGGPVGDAADKLYTEAVVLPLVRGVLKSSVTSLTNGSTSPPSPKRRKHSKRSSTTTTPMEGTEPTTASLAGVSSS